MDFCLFFWPWPWPPPQYPSGGVLVTACGCDFRGVTFQVDLTSHGWLDKLSLVNCLEDRPEARVTSQLDKRNLSSWLVNFHLCSKHKCKTLNSLPNSNSVDLFQVVSLEWIHKSSYIWMALFEKETYKEKPPRLKCSKMPKIRGKIRWKLFCPFHEITGFTLIKSLWIRILWGEFGESRDLFWKQICSCDRR